METNTENTQTSNKVATTIRIEAEVHTAVARIAVEEDRPSIANTYERLLKTHPQVQAKLETAKV